MLLLPLLFPHLFILVNHLTLVKVHVQFLLLPDHHLGLLSLSHLRDCQQVVQQIFHAKIKMAFWVFWRLILSCHI